MANPVLYRNQSIKVRVPWFSSSEWRKVFELIYTERDDLFKRRQDALSIIKVWKTRTSVLPVGLEGTMEILESMVADEEESRKNQNTPSSGLQNMYCMSIMRFLNVVVEGTFAKVGRLYFTATKLEIPQWIIKVRHEIAHSTIKPHIDVLRAAAKFALKWLYEKYWKIENDNMCDYFVNTFETEEITLRMSLNSILSFYDTIVMCNLRYQNISDMPSSSRTTFLEELRNSFSALDLINATVTFETVFIVLLEELHIILESHTSVLNSFEICSNMLISETQFINENALQYTSQTMNRYFVNWGLMVNLFHMSDALPELMKELINLSTNPTTTEVIRTISGKWIEYIAKNVSRLLLIFKHQTESDKKFKIIRAGSEVLSSLPELNSPFILNYCGSVNPFFLGVECIRYLYSKTNGPPDKRIFLSLLLMSSKRFTISDLQKLVSLDNAVDSCDVFNESNNVFTKEHLNDIYKMDVTPKLNGNSMLSIIDCENTNVWKIGSENVEWKKYPIGIVPVHKNDY